MQPSLISKPLFRHARIGGLQIGGAQLLDWHRSETASEVLAQQLGVAGRCLIADVVVGPVAEPALDKGAHRFPARIYVLADSGGGNNLSSLVLRLRFGVVESDVLRDMTAWNWIASNIKIQRTARLPAPCKVAFHFWPSRFNASS